MSREHVFQFYGETPEQTAHWEYMARIRVEAEADKVWALGQRDLALAELARPRAPYECERL